MHVHLYFVSVIGMRYRQDFDRVMRRHEAFWSREPLPRPLVLAHARRQSADAVRVRPVDPITQWTDIDYIVHKSCSDVADTYYAGEAVPHVLAGIQGGVIAAFLGCDMEFRRETNCFLPVIRDWEDYTLSFDTSAKWYRFTIELTETLVEAGKDRFFVDIPDYQSDMDTLSDMRGPQELCLDLYARAGRVKQALSYIYHEVYRPCYRRIHALLTRHAEATTTWLGIMSKQRQDVLQADFMALISPEMTREFVLPNLSEEAAFLDRSIFHLDGPGAASKLDMLLELNDLDGIQWVPGAGSPTALHWLPMLQKIQRRGKVLYLSSPAGEVEPLVRNLEPSGLCISVEHTFAEAEEADEFVERVERWCRDREVP